MASTAKSCNDFDATARLNFDVLSAFDHHRRQLLDRVLKMSDEISDWAQSLISEIREAVAARRCFLDQEYENQKSYIEEKRKEYIQKALVYEKNNDKEQLEQLLTQCDALKFELTALEYSMRSISYLTPMSQSNLKDERLRSTPMDGHENGIEIGVHSTKSSPAIISARNTIKKSRRSLVKKISDNANQSVIYPDTLVDECPICNMVFSLSMKSIDRTIHVEEHFSDNI